MATLFVAEPPSPWAERPRLVVDASLVAAALFAEAGRDEAEAQMRGRFLCAPALIDYELANVALSKIRAKSITADEAKQALDIYGGLAIERWDVELAPVVRVGDRFGLTAYDAAYLWLAGRLRVPIATFDGRVAAAAAAFLKESPRAN